MRSVVCFGGLHHDIKAVASGPVRSGTSNPVTTSRTIGGVACNVARTLARLGIPVRLASVVGYDGDALLESVRSDGVDVTPSRQLDGAGSASYTAILEGRGNLAFGIADMGIYEYMDEKWASMLDVAGDIWFADTNIPYSGLRALSERAGGRLLYIDPVSVEKSGRIRPIIGVASGIFPDLGEALALTGETNAVRAAEALVEMGVRDAVVTLGPDGVCHANRLRVEVRPTLHSGRVSDVTGAGDAFVGGYLAAVSRGEGDPIDWGLAAASLALATIETVPSNLTVDRLTALL
jgi:pseudouridine kinase